MSVTFFYFYFHPERFLTQVWLYFLNAKVRSIQISNPKLDWKIEFAAWVISSKKYWQIHFVVLLILFHLESKLCLRYDGSHGNWLRGLRFEPFPACSFTPTTQWIISGYSGGIDNSKPNDMDRTRFGVHQEVYAPCDEPMYAIVQKSVTALLVSAILDSFPKGRVYGQITPGYHKIICVCLCVCRLCYPFTGGWVYACSCMRPCVWDCVDAQAIAFSLVVPKTQCC